MEKARATTGSAGVTSSNADFPPHMQRRFNALIGLPVSDLRNMCKDLQLPVQGDQRQIVVRLIRRLAGLPPIEADVPLFEEMANKSASPAKKKASPHTGQSQEEQPEQQEDEEQAHEVVEPDSDHREAVNESAQADEGQEEEKVKEEGGGDGMQPAADVDMEGEESLMSLVAGMQPTIEEEESSSDSEDVHVESNRDEGTRVVTLPAEAAGVFLANEGHWISHYQRLAEAAGVPVDLEVCPAVGSQLGSDQDELLPGMHVIALGMKRRKQLRLNGLFGRVLRKSNDEKYWRLRFTDGTETDVRRKHISLRQVPHGEAWLRTRGAVDKDTWATTVAAGRAEHWLCVLAAGLTCCAIPESMQGQGSELGLCDQASSGCLSVDIPSVTMSSVRGIFIKSLMKEFCVVAALVGSGALCVLEEGEGREATIGVKDKLASGKVVEGLHDRRVWRDAEIIDDKGLLIKLRWCFNGAVGHLARQHLRIPEVVDTKLVIYGDLQTCHAAKLCTMAFVEKRVPHYFKIADWPQVAEENAGFLRSHMPMPSMLTSRHLKSVAQTTNAVLEQVGAILVIVAATADQHSQVLDLLKLLDFAANGSDIEEVPATLRTVCVKVRVPEKAADHVFSGLEAIEKETLTLAVWLQPGTKTLIVSDKEKLLVPGKSVHAKYEDEWHEARVVDFDMFSGNVVVEWAFDGSESTLPVSKVNPKLKAEEKQAKKKEQWLNAPWTLAIFGERRGRKEAGLRVLACTEKSCPGLWSVESIEVLDELRDDAGHGATIAVEARQLAGETAEPLFSTLALKVGLSMIRRAAKATKCYMQLMGSLFIVGTVEERARGLDYLRWLLAERLERRRWDESDDVMPDEHDISASTAALRACRKCKNVTHVKATCDQCIWLEPAPLRDLERETDTLIVLDLGHHDAESEWDGSKAAEVHICGHDPKLRRAAAQKLQKLLEAALAWEDPEGDDSAKNDAIIKQLAAKAKMKEQGVEVVDIATLTAKSPSGAAKRPLDTNDDTGVPGNAEKKPREEVTVSSQVPEVVTQERPITPSNPLAELRKLEKWPIGTDDWKTVQDIVWAGHPVLRAGWIRCWSRSKDSEYYYRLVDGVTTYNLSEVVPR